MSIPNRYIIGDAILPGAGTKLTKNAVLNLALCCGAIWRQREKPQYRCTTTIHPVYNCSKKILENLLPVWLLVRTNLFIPSRFWTSYTNFATCEKNVYRCTSTVSALNYYSRFFSQILQLSIRSGAHKLLRRFLDFSQFLTAISSKLWRHLATNVRTT